MEFLVETGARDLRHIAVFPDTTRGYRIVISSIHGSGSEADITLQQVGNEHEMTRLLLEQGVAPTEIRRQIFGDATGLGTVLTAIAGALPIGLLLAMALAPVFSGF